MVTDLPPARVLEVEPAAYLKLPGLSPSIAHALLSTCALKARDKYLRNLEPAKESDDDGDDEATEEQVPAEKQSQLDRGDIFHALLLGIGKRIDVIPDALLSGKSRSYSSAAAKLRRDAARASGRIPVKELRMPQYEQAAAEIRERLAAAGHVLDGTSEMAIEWYESSPHGPVQCRTMIDHVAFGDAGDSTRPLAAFVFELKFPGDASPDRTERTADNLGYPIAAAARLRALNALYPTLAGRIEYRYLCCETQRPYAFWDPTPTGHFLEYGARQWRSAVNRWAEGESAHRWMGYHEDNGRRMIDLPRYRKMQEGIPIDEE